MYKRNNKYWVAFRYNRKRYRKASPDNTYAGAKSFEALLRQKLAKGESIEIEEKKKINISSFQDFADKWMKTYVVTNNKPSEQNQKQCMINKHLKPYFGRLALDKITSMQLEEFKAKKQANGLSNKSINNILGILGKCLKTAQEWEIIDKTPKIKPLKVAPKDPVYLNQEDYNKLLETAKDEGIFYEMLLFTLRTGVRIGELLALEWSDISFNDKVVTIKRNIVNGHLGSPKNNKHRRIYLAQVVYDVLMVRRKNQGLVFPNINGDYQSRSSCRHRLERLCLKANVKKLGWHGLRHSFASQLATNGVSLKTIQEL
ncbi:MAG: tyrosine-type recombinase/integrase, partial [Dysgonamonadaceae bacterium]|nr:tyrosine-type recombinase/integrase [Dysgonamonadaceae bacterium]